MDPNQLNKFFPFDNSTDSDTGGAIADLLIAGREFAQTLQRLLPESQKKFDLHMGLLSIVREAEFALRLDGPQKAPASPIVMVKQ